MSRLEWLVVVAVGACVFASWLFPPWIGEDQRYFLFAPAPGDIEVDTGRWVLEASAMLILGAVPFLLVRWRRERRESRSKDGGKR